MQDARISNRLFYLSIPPNLFIHVAKCACMSASSSNGWTRVIVEKPFGRDSESSAALTRGLRQYLDEDQIFRYSYTLSKICSSKALSVFLFTMSVCNAELTIIWGRN